MVNVAQSGLRPQEAETIATPECQLAPSRDSKAAIVSSYNPANVHFLCMVSLSFLIPFVTCQDPTRSLSILYSISNKQLAVFTPS